MKVGPEKTFRTSLYDAQEVKGTQFSKQQKKKKKVLPNCCLLLLLFAFVKYVLIGNSDS